MNNFSLDEKSLVLGTALWGWGISKTEAFELLEKFLELGGAVVDTAINYPINKNPNDFGLAVNWIRTWVSSNPNSNLSLLAKIGSIDNSGAPHTDLTQENTRITANRLLEQFGSNLGCISIHWDNRGQQIEDLPEIKKTINALKEIQQSGISLGLSGIKHPKAYYNACPELSESWIIQVKENFTTSSARRSYEQYFPNAKYIAYGINLGGMNTGPARKDSSASLRNITHPQGLMEQLTALLESKHSFTPRPSTLNELALANAYINPALTGVIIGPRNPDQLSNSIEYWKELEAMQAKDGNTSLIDHLKKLKA